MPCNVCCCLAIARGQAVVVWHLFVESIGPIKVDRAWSSRLCGQPAQVSAASLMVVRLHNGLDKLNQGGHEGGIAWAAARMSLNMVKPNPIHGCLLLLVYRSRKSDAVSNWSEWKQNSRHIFLGVRVEHALSARHQVPILHRLNASVTQKFLVTINYF
jgi:hypothetical protein